MSASGAHSATLAYDPLGRMWQVSSSAGTTRFLYDGDHPVIEYDGGGTVLRAYVHGAGADEPLFWYEATPSGVSRRYLHADHQGSIVAVSDEYGNPIAVTAYDAWGIPNAGGVGFAPGAVGRFGYTGQAWLPELGLYYYKARIYSPTLGRFLQTDPVGYEDQVNLYAYVSNDPVNHVDPTGQTDISLMSQWDPASQNYVGSHFDIPGTVTALSHGGVAPFPHIAQRAGPEGSRRWNIVPPQSFAQRVNSVSRTQPVALFACHAGMGYAQQLSQALGGRPVIATAGWVTSSVGRDGTVTIGARDANGRATTFNIYGQGNWSNYGINVPSGYHVYGFSYNDRTHEFRVNMAGEQLGSRIPRVAVQIWRKE